jgi:hypothetical protein
MQCNYNFLFPVLPVARKENVGTHWRKSSANISSFMYTDEINSRLQGKTLSLRGVFMHRGMTGLRG